jgi:membrane-bound ClpP family serine protease
VAADIPAFMDLLHDLDKGCDLDLLLHTPGGDVDQAERIVLLCRKRAKSFRVIVPDSAKSAGTLIALAADEIVMGEPSELGPIDPQITITLGNGEVMSRPAQSFLDGLEEIVSEAAKTGKLSPAYFPLLDKLDPALIDFCRKALARSEQFAERFLAAYMLKGEPDAPNKAKVIAKDLNDVKKHLSHGAVIDHQRAQDMGLVVRYLEPVDPLWQRCWRLYCEQLIALDPTQRLFESARGSLVAGIRQ